MNFFQKTRSRLRMLFGKDRFDTQMDDEMRSHIEMQAQENREAGMTPEEARYAALRQFGRVEPLKERCRDERGIQWLERLGQDVRYGARMLRKNPGFTAVAALTLALGIGANTSIFTVINTALLRSLPVEHPDELVQVMVVGQSSYRNYAFSYPYYERLRDEGRSLSGLFAAGGVGSKDRLRTANQSGAEAEFVRAQPVSGNFFSVLGVPVALGRVMMPEDDRPGNAQAVAVISHQFWQRRFGGDPAAIGMAVSFDDMPFTIIGVTPPGFFGFEPGENPDLWWPLQMVPRVVQDPGRLKEGNSWLRLMGRLADGVRRKEAETELAVIHQRYSEDYAAARAAKWSNDQKQRFFAQKFQLRPGQAGWSAARDQIRQPLFILMAVVTAVLLIACANVASLLLARAAAREREFSIRSALGAGRVRLVCQWLTESLLLAALGGALGFAFAQGGTRLLQRVMQLQADSVSLSLAPDTRVLFFTTAVALLTGLLFGLAPAFRSRRADLASTLKGASGSVAGCPSRQRLHQALVVVQVALSLVLLIGAGLFVRTLRNLARLDAGFDRENIVLFNIDFTQRPDAARWPVLYKELLGRLEALPGVRSASLFSEGYLSGNSWTDSISAEGFTAEPGENLECAGARVGPKFFETFGTALLSGREFGPQDEGSSGPSNAPAPGTAVINQAMARRYFGDANPVGRRFYLTHRPEMRFEIVGLVPDAKYRSLREASPPAFYIPFFRNPNDSWANFALRTSGDPRQAMAALPGAMRELDRTLRVSGLRTMNDVVNKSLHQERLIGQLGGFFSIFSLALACLGLYGVLSFAVTQRTREIGVRMALGAHRSHVLFLVIGKGLKLVLVGLALGLAGALMVTRVVSNLLYGVTAADPLTFAAVSLLLIIVASLASWLPARRATKVNPMTALRCE